MMKRFCVILLLLVVSGSGAHGQVENVPATHPVYTFLKRMEVKGIIERYHDAILPLSRRQVADFLLRVQEHSDVLTSAERGYLQDVLTEFQYEITGLVQGFHSLISPEDSVMSSGVSGVFSNREKYLYAYKDSTLTFFVNGILNLDTRRISGDALGSQHVTYAQFGGRVRGTVFQHLGYYLQGMNAQFSGSRDLLRRDPVINQAYTLNILNAKNFDFVEGYVRYDAKILSAQVGRERLLWGNGYSEKMIASDNVRVYDFIRADAEYKSLKYTYIHAWLLGKRTEMVFSLPGDTSAIYDEPVVADKYFAAHRIEFSFPSLFDIGGQEMVIYSNRSPDLAYLNPVTLIESAQRSREERDNVFWAFDIQTHFIPNVEFHGTFLLDDLNFPELFTDVWTDRHAVQAGMMCTDPLGIENMSVMIEYTKVKPYVFAHNRSRENDYGSLGSPLGARIGPNADAWFFRMDYLPLRNLNLSVRVTLERKGMNVYDVQGNLLKNVGGDILQPHRLNDPVEARFLDGTLARTRRVDINATYEIINQVWLDGLYEYESMRIASQGFHQRNHTVVGRVRVEF